MMDFSADPAVGAAFASAGAHVPVTQKGVIYVTPIELAIEHGLRIVLAPSFVDRIYLQRGVFIEPAPDEQTIPSSTSYELRFPAMYDFEVVRRGATVALREADQYLEPIARWAEGFGEQSEDFPTGEKECQELCTRLISDLALVIPSQGEREISSRVAGLFFYLTTFLDGDTMCVNQSLVSHIARSNLPVARALLADFDRLFVIDDGPQPAVFAHLKAALDEALTYSGDVIHVT